MSRYRPFHNDDQHSSAILPEIELEDIEHVEIRSSLKSSSRFRQCLMRRTRLEFILMISWIVLFISLIIVLIRKPPSSIGHETKSSISLCLTSPCLDLSSSMLSAMNQSVDPCDDFHQFVCGRWIRTHLIPKGHPSWSMMKILSEKNLIVLKSLFEQNPTESMNRPEDQVKRFYRSCLNLTELDRLNRQPIEEFFQRNFNWSLYEWRDLQRNETHIDLFIRMLNWINIHYGISTIFPIDVSADEKNSSWYTIHINQPQLILNSRDYYVQSTNNPKNVLIREKYVEVGANLLQLLGFEKNQSIERMKGVLQLEIELAEISLPMEILQRPTETYALISLEQLENQYKSIGLNVTMLFNDLFNTYRSDRIEINSNDPIVVLSLDLMRNLSSIVQSYLLTPGKSHILLDHLLVSFIFEFSSQLASIFDETILPLKKVLIGTDSLPDRWEFCVKQTDTAFGYVTGSMYVDVVFGESDKKQAQELIKNLREALRENLDQLSWIDGETRDQAKNKLEKIKEKIAYPDLIRNRTELIQRYENYSMTENEYFHNTLQIYQHERRRILRRFRRSVDRNEWSMTPRMVNAYYSPSFNEIVFPAGILQPPFFHKDLPLAINYGSIGSIIGHEMTHGFDNQGREFDAEGNMRSWWTNHSMEKYQEKTKCFIEQYSNYSIDGLRTLGENIADNGGIKIAYRAYRKHQSNGNAQLPGLNYTADQLFFIAFAHGWCSVETEEAKRSNSISDPHASTRYRIIGTVMNSEEFSSSFSCAKPSRMNPTQKCQLW